MVLIEIQEVSLSKEKISEVLVPVPLLVGTGMPKFHQRVKPEACVDQRFKKNIFLTKHFERGKYSNQSF